MCKFLCGRKFSLFLVNTKEGDCGPKRSQHAQCCMRLTHCLPKWLYRFVLLLAVGTGSLLGGGALFPEAGRLALEATGLV